MYNLNKFLPIICLTLKYDLNFIYKVSNWITLFPTIIYLSIKAYRKLGVIFDPNMIV